MKTLIVISKGTVCFREPGLSLFSLRSFLELLANLKGPIAESCLYTHINDQNNHLPKLLILKYLLQK